jgi:uncharacterized protein (DUF58 family)
MLRSNRSSINRRTEADESDAAPRRVVRRLRRHPILYGIVVVMILEFLTGMATGFDLSVRLYYALGFLLIGGWLWAKSSSEQMTADIKRPSGPFTVGDTITEEVTLRSSGGTPKAWVEVEDQTDIPGVQLKKVATLGLMIAFDRIEMKAKLSRRGEYTLGPVIARTSDPFSMFPQEVRFGEKDSILVYPKMVDIPDFATPSVHLVGDNTRRQRARILSTDVSSVREYVAGDSISRIHWLSTARTGQLMVKQFDQGSSSDMWVLFDQHADAVVEDGDDSSDELAATIAASVINKYSKGLLPVGYVAHGSQSLVAWPDRTTHQRDQVLRHIATSKPHGEVPLMESLGTLEREFGMNTSLVVVTAAEDGPWVDALAGLAKRGVRVNVVLIDRSSYGADSNQPAIDHMIATGVTVFSVSRFDPIEGALSSPVGAMTRVAAPQTSGISNDPVESEPGGESI